MSKNRFDAWATFDLSGQCRMQAKEQLDPEFSEFMLAVASRLDALAPAPDSTRTGPVGTEEAAKALYRHDYGAYPDQPEWDAAPAAVQARYRSLASAARPPAPEGYRLISAEMAPPVMERMAFNLSAEFGPDFVMANKAFALAVYAEAYASGGRPAAPEAQGAERRPIETAPKDRSEILLFGTRKSSRAEPSWFVGSWFPVGSYGNGWWVSSCVEIIATEWAPLPAPPSPGQGER